MAMLLAAGAGATFLALTARAVIKASAQRSASGAFYRGGFEPTMNRREAALILGIRESASKEKIKEAHRRLMLLNHPDRGGSPLIASKVNEAKGMLDKRK